MTIDPTALSGPSEAVPIERESESENITITIPTAAPTAWNDTIGTTFDDGESNARVADYDATDEERGSLTIELAEAEYELQIARVGIGDGGERTPEYDVESTRPEGETTGSGSGAYDIEWNLNRIDAENDRVSCTADRCTFDAAGAGDTAALIAETDPSIDDATVEYAVSDRDVGRVDPGSGSTRDGVHRTGLEARAEGAVTAFASSGGNGDRVPIEIAFAGASGPFFAVATDRTNSPVLEGETLSVTVTVENTGSEAGTRDIALDIGGQRRDATAVSLGAGESTRVTLEWATTDGDAGEYTAVVASADSDATAEATVESAAGPTVDSFTTEQRPGNTVGIRYGWSVSSGDAELDTVTVELSRDRTSVHERTTAASGGTASAKNEEFPDLGNGQEYTLELTVTDVKGNSRITTRRQIAG